VTTATQRHRIETFTGKFFDYDEPAAEQVCVEDIAHALSQVCRFGGHTRTFYSVAEHCVLASRLLENTSAHDYRLAALLHDAHEAYLGDLPTPLKNAIGPPYHEMVGATDVAIAEACGLKAADFKSGPVVWADAVALRLEAHKLKHTRGEHPEWDVAWEKHNLRDVTLLAPMLRAVDVEAWQPGLSSRDAEDGFLSTYDRLTGRC
jgi:hypothetical protein